MSDENEELFEEIEEYLGEAPTSTDEWVGAVAQALIGEEENKEEEEGEDAE